MRLSLALLLLCVACTEHGKGGGMVCQGLVFVPSPRAPADVTTCTSQIAGDPETLYASCDDGFPNLFECVAPNGSGVCLDGRRTTLCQLDTDCIPGFRCAETFGIRACEKECAVDLDCIRCEMFCNTNEGVCSEVIAMPGGGGEDL